MTPEHTEMAIATAIAFVCGIAQFTQGVREGRNQKTVFDLITDIASAMIGGGIGYFGAHELGYSSSVCYVAVLVCANNAAEVQSKAWGQVSNILNIFKPGAKK